MRVKTAFNACRDGEVHPSRIEAGSECPPELIGVARELGALETPADTRKREAAERKAEVERLQEEAAQARLAAARAAEVAQAAEARAVEAEAAARAAGV